MTDDKYWPLARCYRFAPWTVLAVTMTGGFFFQAGSPFEQHPLSVPGGREVFLSACLLAAALHVHHRLRIYGNLPLGEAAILAFVPSAILTSASLAYLAYDQPLQYGLIEERRMLSFYAVFLIGATLRGTATPFEDLLGAVYWAALIYTGLGLLLQTGILGDLANRDVPFLDPRKYRIICGINIYAQSAALAALMLVRTRSMAHAVPLLVGIVGLLAVGQTRSTALQLVGAVPIVLMAASAAGLVMLLVLAGLAGSAVLINVAPFLRPGGQSGIGEVDVRLETIRKCLDTLAANDGIGLGSLSLQWNNGFHRIYDRFFYLTDVGVFGELYRYGVLLPIFYGALAAAILLYAASATDTRTRDAMAMLAMIALLGVVSQGLMALTGSDWALLLSFAVAGRYRRTEPTFTARATGLPRAGVPHAA